MVDVEAVIELFEALHAELVSAERNALIAQVPGFRRLKCDTSRFARFDVATLTTFEAFCCVRDDVDTLVLSRFPLKVRGRVSVKHERTRISALKEAFLQSEPVSAGWSGSLPDSLKPPSSLPVDSRIQINETHQVVVVSVPIQGDEAVVPSLVKVSEWISAFATAAARNKQPWTRHHVEAAKAAIVDLTAERLRVQRDHAMEKARFNELTRRAEAFRATKRDADVRRTLETRIACRRNQEGLGARLKEIEDDVARIRSALPE